MAKLLWISRTIKAPEGRVRVTDVLADEGVWIELVENGGRLHHDGHHSFYISADEAAELVERIEGSYPGTMGREHWRFILGIDGAVSITWLLGMKSATLTAKQADTFAKQLIAVITEKRHRRNKEESHG